MAEIIISEENVKEFSRKINNLIRMQVIITEDLLQSLAAQILRKELIRQEELAYLLAKSKVAQSKEELLAPRPIAQEAPSTKEFVPFDIEEIAEIISQSISKRLSTGVAQGTISTSLASVVSTSTQPTAVAAAINKAQHNPVPTTLTSTNPYANAMLQSAPVKSQHQQALSYNQAPARNAEEESKASKSRITLNTMTEVIDNIGEQAQKEQLSVRTTELSVIGWMLFDIFNEVFDNLKVSSQPQPSENYNHNSNYGWDPRLLCQHLSLGRITLVNEEEDDNSYSF